MQLRHMILQSILPGRQALDVILNIIKMTMGKREKRSNFKGVSPRIFQGILRKHD